MWLDLHTEVLAEFEQRYSERLEDALYIRYQCILARYRVCDEWRKRWPSTAERARVQNRSRSRRAYHKREAIVVAERVCKCGRTFKANKNRPNKKVCAVNCKFMRQRPPMLFWGKWSVADMARRAGVQYQTMKLRFKAGWSLKRALNTPGRK